VQDKTQIGVGIGPHGNDRAIPQANADSRVDALCNAVEHRTEVPQPGSAGEERQNHHPLLVRRKGPLLGGRTRRPSPGPRAGTSTPKCLVNTKTSRTSQGGKERGPAGARLHDWEWENGEPSAFIRTPQRSEETASRTTRGGVRSVAGGRSGCCCTTG